MRLDKFLADMGYGSRKEVKQLIKKGSWPSMDKSSKVTKHKYKKHKIPFVLREPIAYQSQFYYLLNKPAGVISATVDSYEETVLDLFSEEAFREDLFPVGRLDKDTEGFADYERWRIGASIGRLRSMWKKNIMPKSRESWQRRIKNLCQRHQIRRRVDLAGWAAILNVDENESRSEIKLILHEGKFHQVKRMVHAVGKEVVYLKRMQACPCQMIWH